MTQPSVLAELEDLQKVFVQAGYNCELTELGRFARVLIAQNAYGIVAATETHSWKELAELASDLQAELTHLALREQKQAVRWDLYIFIHVRSGGLQSIETDVLERVESDTRYARKFVRVNLRREAAVLDRALRPFLPLRKVVPIKSLNPLDLLRQELVTGGLDADLVNEALREFAATGEIVLL